MSQKDSFATYFHSRTKYDPDTIANIKGAMQGPQPELFKSYRLGSEVDLKPYLHESKVSPEASSEDRGWARLSHFLINVYGLTAQLKTQFGQAFYLRSAPSAGGLYPTELYLVSRGNQLLPAGLYNYQVRTHSLLRFWDDHVWQALQESCFWHPALEQTQLAMVLSTVFYRSAWRYQDRAYRRICLDAGHVLGNLELASALVDYRPHLIGGFADSALNQMLYLDESAESTLAVVALADLLQVEQNLSHSTTTQPARSQTDFPKVADGELLPYMHQVTCIEAQGDFRWQVRSPSLADQSSPNTEAVPDDKYNFPFCLRVPTVTSPINWDDRLQGLERTILRRRSTRRFSGANLTLDELNTVLDFVYQPHHYVEQGLDGDPDYFDLSLIQTFVAVSGVDSLDAGCYYYAPYKQEFRQIRFKNFRQELEYLCLGQALGRDAGAVIFHTADLQQAIARHGDRAYRYLHLDAGHLGQRINIAAVRLDLGVSGIGGFFDDQVNDVLGIPEDEAVLYITTLGRPADSV
ncbi:SagB/ThcOx family dehydrogenase [Oscillatoria sp. CS-180]|uniref:SagB/ThcOx family dehydrogenase n=1 Tax=Oscillatoria sp. CS-180 TaxID=3021720 RepID=UPI00232A869E|nr:SagB/ThcOx family dehydrogenase [Oscillatoria sp. CS-180]MDB9527719.1 SagB/ThcOx family dehydrogenase [Oscillatoria sp. CS-180]